MGVCWAVLAKLPSFLGFISIGSIARRILYLNRGNFPDRSRNMVAMSPTLGLSFGFVEKAPDVVTRLAFITSVEKIGRYDLR